MMVYVSRNAARNVNHSTQHTLTADPLAVVDAILTGAANVRALLAHDLLPGVALTLDLVEHGLAVVPAVEDDLILGLVERDGVSLAPELLGLHQHPAPREQFLVRRRLDLVF